MSRPIVLPERPLAAGPVGLRTWRDDDVPALVAMCRDPDVIRFTSISEDYDEHDARVWLTLHPGRLAAGDGVSFAIVEPPGDEAVGSVGARVLHDQEAAEVGYHVAAAARGRGLASAALALVSPWLLAALPIARLQLTTHLDNVASQRMAEKAGYTREGVLRAWAEQRGTRVDLVMYSLLPRDLVPTV